MSIRIFSYRTCQECLKLQRQLNILWGTIRRLRWCLKEQDDDDIAGVTNEFTTVSISQAPSHKLNTIAQGLVDLLLASSVKRQITISKRTAENLFKHLWLTSCSAAQLSVAALLSQSDDSSRWMPNFLAEMLRKTLSSDASTALIPKDRLVHNPSIGEYLNDKKKD